MSVRSVPRYPEVREDGSMWVPLAPPPAPKYRQLSQCDTGVVGIRAALSYSTEWLLDLRVFTDPYEERARDLKWVVQLCGEGAWHDFVRHGKHPDPKELVVASVRLVFLVDGTALEAGF